MQEPPEHDPWLQHGQGGRSFHTSTDSREHENPWSYHTTNERSDWPVRITIGVAIAVAAVGIPTFSLYLDDVYRETVVMVAHAGELDSAEKIRKRVKSPRQMKRAVKHLFSPRDRMRIRNELGLGPDVPPEVVKARLMRYARDFRQGNFSSIPPNLKQLAIDRIGMAKLLALKARMQKMNLNEQQMVAFAKRELRHELRELEDSFEKREKRAKRERKRHRD